MRKEVNLESCLLGRRTPSAQRRAATKTVLAAGASRRSILVFGARPRLTHPIRLSPAPMPAPKVVVP